MGAKQWIIFGAIVAIVIGGLVFVSMRNRLDISDISDEAAMQIMSGEERSGDIADHVKGNPEANIVIIEYGDYQCAGCASAAAAVAPIVEKYEDNVALVFRNFPLTTIHPNARIAAAAAEAAGKQGKYWEMHDLLFENQNNWAAATVSERTGFFSGYAEQLGLDVEQFEADVTSGEIRSKMDFDVALGVRKGVTGTPAFFINGEEIANIHDEENGLEARIVALLREQGVEVEE